MGRDRTILFVWFLKIIEPRKHFFKGQFPSGAIPSVGNTLPYDLQYWDGSFRTSPGNHPSDKPTPEGCKAQLGPSEAARIRTLDPLVLGSVAKPLHQGARWTPLFRISYSKAGGSNHSACLVCSYFDPNG